MLLNHLGIVKRNLNILRVLSVSNCMSRKVKMKQLVSSASVSQEAEYRNKQRAASGPPSSSIYFLISSGIMTSPAKSFG